jgi:HSP20 family protein
MSSSAKRPNIRKRDFDESSRSSLPTTTAARGRLTIDDIFDNFRTDLEDIFSSWPSPWFRDWRFPTTALPPTSSTPLYDLVDKGDKYELQVELPGMDKDKVNIKARKDSVDISAEQTLSEEDKKKNYVYRSRSYSSYNATIPIPDEILPDNVKAKMNHGLSELELRALLSLKKEKVLE